MRLPPIPSRRKRSAGFTILELMVVVAIVLILTAIGIVQSQEMVPRYRTRRAALTFSSLINQCRTLAIQTNRECSVFLVDFDSDLSNLSSNVGEYWVGVGDQSNGSSSWDYLPPDSLSDSSDDDVSLGIVDLNDEDNPYYARHVGLATWGSTLTGPGTGNSDRIVFDSRGFVSNPAADFGSAGTIQLTFVNKVARNKGVTQDFTVSISRSGMTRVDSTANTQFGSTASGTASSSSGT